MSFKKGFRRFWDDLLTPKLVLFKIIFFFLLGGILLLWPQFTLHQEAIGLTKYQTGIVGIVMSAVTIVVPLLAGMAGDKLGNCKVVLSISTVVAGVGAFLFTVVPRAEAATFWVYMIVRVSFGAFQGFSFTLYEGVVMAYAQEYNVDYGFQRAWGTLAVFISSLLGGYITEATKGFSMIFYLSTGAHIVTGGLMMFLNVEFKLPAQSLSKQLLKQLASAEVLMFLGAMLAVGMFIGYIETFMYRYLSELGASPFLIGLTVTVGAPLEIPFTLVSSSLVAKVGHAPVIMLGLLTYSVRLLGISFLSNPWWSLALEVLESVANGLTFPAAIMYCTVLFSMETITSSRGLMGLTYFGIGKLVGTAVGTEIRESVGDVQAFRWLSGAALVATVLYCVGFAALKRKRSRTAAVPQLTPPNEKRDLGGIDNPAMECGSVD